MPRVEIEKRSCVRFEIPGASLSFKTIKSDEESKDYGEEFCPVADISRGGLRFLTKSQLKSGTRVSLKIAVPGEQIPLMLRGVVRWVGKHAGPSYKFQIGVQFNPYGDESRDQNYPGALVKIIALEQKFALTQE